MNIGKVLVGVVILVLATVAIIVGVVVSNIDDIVRTVVEDVGSDELQTNVKLEDVNIDLLAGRVELGNLVIENPEGYSTPDIFQMNSIVVHVDIMSLLDNTVSIKEILIDGANITAEQKGRNTNVQELLDNFNESSSTEENAGSDNTSPEGDDLLIKVALFKLVNSSARLVTDKWGEKELQLKDIELTDIGGDDGVAASQLVEEVLRPVIEELQSSTERRLKEIVREKAKEKIKEKTDAIKEKAKSALGEDNVDKLKSLFSR